MRLRAQHERAAVVISGPSSDGTTGIYVLRAPSRQDAAAIAATDPLAHDDRVTVDVIEWDVHQILGVGSFNHPERDHPERDHPERDHPERGSGHPR
jgi:hypothetical protein